MSSKKRIQIYSAFIILLGLLLLNPTENYAQNQKSALQQNVRRLEGEISYTNKLLESTRQNKSNSLEELVLLNNKIKQRESLIDIMTKEIQFLTKSIGKNEEEIEKLNKELEQLKKEYGKLIYFAYKNRNSSDRLMFIFSAESFNQAYQRLKYLQYYGVYRKNQAVLIEQTKDTLNAIINKLAEQKTDKESLIKNQQKEVRKLNLEKSDKQRTINKLGKKERQLRADLREKQQEADRLTKAIEDIIAKEIRLAAQKKNAEKKEASIAMTPDEHKLSSTFFENKGKLPWPTERGVISSTFGIHPHPVLKRNKIKNNGINILTVKGQKVRSIFNGVVISIRTIHNHKVVLLRHGEYFSVYSNLSTVSVRQGENIKTKQEIGIINTDISNGKTELHFEIWKGTVIQNPASWLAKSSN